MPIFSIINKTKLLIFLIVFCFVHFSYAQDKTNDLWKGVRFGGGFGLNFSDTFFSATIAPSAIYEFNEIIALGFGLNATFNNQKSIYKSTILGGSIISLFNIINEIQLSAEFEQLNVNRRYNVNLNIEDDNYWIPALFLGAGYRNGNITFGIRYDILYNNQKSIYADSWAPFVRLYF
ncbi:alpha-ketoglutarate decarboxylase [Thalassobellus suaedae]|uniref:Alpha-ketoglutarate decarboxylase n=1 Tax=Thalassobellus suaedae TaxID=3074124 RepID=A0ABY9XSW2_9FLAO|nr:alpha-ketoglutarate decarboxylase [Flavobacteriaceae bacterium HL-DH14]WNH14274.1 alpha-ketoglutarate decarboxylase [Flavobacteriaceae bacterium HL-DH10]